MGYITQQQQDTGLYVPTTQQFDPSMINSIDVNSEDFKQLIVSLYQYTNMIALVLNDKDSGYYNNQEFVNGQSFFNPTSNNPNDRRQVFRKVIDFGVLGAATKSVAHDITVTASTIFTRIYGVASKTTVARSYLPLPYSSVVAVANNIELSVNATNVTIANGINRTAFNQCYVIVEYLQN